MRNADHISLGPGAEFDALRAMLARWGDLAVGIGDDAAVLPDMPHAHRVVSTDACVEDVHFRAGWITPQELGARAAAAALSDLAAMGAHADSVLMAAVIPPAWDAALLDIADGFGAVVRDAGAHIVGGNLSRGATLSLTTTVLGHAVYPVGRGAAQPGDVLVCTGLLGGPGAAVQSWFNGQEPAPWARTRFAGPVPRLAEGHALAHAGARAMCDISDGLLADASHLAAASGVRLVLDPARIPCGPAITREQAMHSGEEYELLAALPTEALAELEATWATPHRTPLTVIGHVEASDTPGVLLGATRVVFPRGHDHFSG